MTVFLIMISMAAGQAEGGRSLPPAPTIVFPRDAGVADVRREYGAKGDGVTDDTDALLRAFHSNNDDHGRLIYFPAGPTWFPAS